MGSTILATWGMMRGGLRKAGSCASGPMFRGTTSPPTSHGTGSGSRGELSRPGPAGRLCVQAQGEENAGARSAAFRLPTEGSLT